MNYNLSEIYPTKGRPRISEKSPIDPTNDNFHMFSEHVKLNYKNK